MNSTPPPSSLRVRVLLFAGTRAAAGGQAAVTIDLPSDATVAELRTRLVAEYPQLATLGSRLLISIDQRYALDDQPVRPDDEVACFSTASGG